MANFHKVLFEHKVIEALELLASLGATSIQVGQVSGQLSAKEVAAQIPFPTILTELGAAGRRQDASVANMVYTAELRPPRRPFIPEGLAWFPREPLWQSIAKLRLEGGLSEFSLYVRYDEDFGVNAKVTAKVSNVGLDLGGGFTNYVSTVWHMKGEFANLGGLGRPT